AKKDEKESFRWNHAAAEQGVLSAMIATGHGYDAGTGVKKDHAKAYFWLELASFRDHDNAPLKKEALKAKKRLKKQEIAETDGQIALWKPHQAEAPAPVVHAAAPSGPHLND